MMNLQMWDLIHLTMVYTPATNSGKYSQSIRSTYFHWTLLQMPNAQQPLHVKARRISNNSALKISRGIFSPKNSEKTPHSSPVRASYGASAVSSISEQNFSYLPERRVSNFYKYIFQTHFTNWVLQVFGAWVPRGLSAWVPHNSNGENSTLVQVMARCRQAISVDPDLWCHMTSQEAETT